ncbi:MAG: DUF512 domain-containing protein [Eubacteriales bacterium]
MGKKKHIIHYVEPNSIASELEIEVHDVILAVNGEAIDDIFDYQFQVQGEYIEVLIEKQNGEEWLLEIEKDEMEDIGIEFDTGLMDQYRSCTNQCIFCFIDQLPKGMRETLYFKDDDSRLSFLQGNYVTLTNMSDHEIDRIIKYHLSPINISFQTTNPELRCKMLHNRFAGEALKQVDRLYEAGITLNGQIVLCKNVNDGVELERSIKDLMKYLPNLESVSVVPVGLSKYRDGLYPLEPFTREDAREVIALIHRYQKQVFEQTGSHFIHASDEWYLLAGLELPQEETYDGYLQLANGVGMIRSLVEEVVEELDHLQDQSLTFTVQPRAVSIGCGMLARSCIEGIAKKVQVQFPQISITVYPIHNDFFGEQISVTGLLTGQDLIAQLKDQELGEILLLSEHMFRSGESVLLDNVTVEELEKALQVKVNIVKSSGYDLIHALIKE